MSTIVYPIEAPKAQRKPTKASAEANARAGALVTRFRKGFEECHGYPVDYDRFKAQSCARAFITRNPQDAEAVVDGLFSVWKGSFRGSVQGFEILSKGSAWVIGQLKEDMKSYEMARSAGDMVSMADIAAQYPNLGRA